MCPLSGVGSPQPWVHWQLTPTPSFKGCPPGVLVPLTLDAVSAFPYTQVQGVLPLMGRPLDPDCSDNSPRHQVSRGVPLRWGSCGLWVWWQIPRHPGSRVIPPEGDGPLDPGCRVSSPRHQDSRAVLPRGGGPLDSGCCGSSSRHPGSRGYPPGSRKSPRPWVRCQLPLSPRLEECLPRGGGVPLNLGVVKDFPDTKVQRVSPLKVGVSP